MEKNACINAKRYMYVLSRLHVCNSKQTLKIFIIFICQCQPKEGKHQHHLYLTADTAYDNPST